MLLQQTPLEGDLSVSHWRLSCCCTLLVMADSARCLPDAGGSVASYLTMSRGVGYSLGASGAVFGLFAVSVLCKLSFNFKKLLEAAILGQFVVKQVLQVLNPTCPPCWTQHASPCFQTCLEMSVFCSKWWCPWNSLWWLPVLTGHLSRASSCLP